MTDTAVRNVFFLSVDSLQYPAFREYFPDLGNEIDAVNFRNTVATASNTRCSAPTFHAGVYSDSEQIHDSPVQIPETGSVTTVAEQFAAEGYTTGFWTPNHIFGGDNNYDRGFEYGNQGEIQTNKRIADIVRKYGNDTLWNIANHVYFHYINTAKDALTPNGGHVWQPAEGLQDEVLEWLGTDPKEPIFCWLHYMDTHHPFEPPVEYLERFSFNRDWSRNELSYFTRDAIKTDARDLSEEEIEDVKTAYLAACSYLGDQIADFINELIKREHFDPARDLLCITSDHGEAFSPDKHGMFGHASFFEEIIRVPLLVSMPNWDQQFIDEQVSLIDLMPTVIDAADVDVPGHYIGEPCSTPTEMTREHTYLVDGNPLRRGIRGERWKLFGHRIGDDQFELVLTEIAEGEKLAEEIKYRTTIDELESPSPTVEDELLGLWDQLESTFGPPLDGPVTIRADDLYSEVTR